MGTVIVNAETQNKVRYIDISADHEGRRIDNFLFGMLKNVPKNRIYRMLRKGEVRVDGRRIKQDYRLQEGEKLRLPPVFNESYENKIEPGYHILEQIKKNIIYKDSNLIVLNKPVGIAVHGGTGQPFGVIEAVRKIFHDENNTIQLAHRLDKETSGVLMLAKNMKYLKYLHENLKARRIYKLYKALLYGHISARQLKIELPLGRKLSISGERIVTVSDEGKNAQTIIRLEKYIGENSLVDVELSTGRTHQIRVHANELSHPVAGDSKYGNKNHNKLLKKYGLNRLFLHACQIKVPGNEHYRPVSVVAPLPDDLNAVLKSLTTKAK